jgi:hypothetical protein
MVLPNIINKISSYRSPERRVEEVFRCKQVPVWAVAVVVPKKCRGESPLKLVHSRHFTSFVSVGAGAVQNAFEK